MRIPLAAAHTHEQNEPGRIGVVIVDDEALARGILREWLGGHPDVEILTECGNGFQAATISNRRTTTCR